MAPTIKKKKSSKKAVQINPKSAEYADKREYRRGFKANKKYARRHGAFMFVSRGPFDWTKLHFAVWKDDLNAVKSYVEYHQTTKPEVLLKKGQWGETALQLALRLERSPEMISVVE